MSLAHTQRTVYLPRLPSLELMALTFRLCSTSFVTRLPEPSREGRDLQLSLRITYGNSGEMMAQLFHVLVHRRPTQAGPLCPGAPHTQRQARQQEHRRRATTDKCQGKRKVSNESHPRQEGARDAGSSLPPPPSPGPSTPSLKHALSPYGGRTEKTHF